MQKYLKNVANKIAFWDMCWDPIHLWYVQNTMIGITQKGGKCPGIFTIKLHFQMLSVDPDIWYPGKYLLKSISPDYRVRTWENVLWRAILNICLCCELSKKKTYILITQYFDFILWKKFRCLAYQKNYCFSIIAHFPQILLQ